MFGFGNLQSLFSVLACPKKIWWNESIKEEKNNKNKNSERKRKEKERRERKKEFEENTSGAVQKIVPIAWSAFAFFEIAFILAIPKSAILAFHLLSNKMYTNNQNKQ